MYLIEYAGQTNTQYQIYATRPNIPATKRKYTEYKIPGRDGTLYDYEETVEDITIAVKFGFFCKPELWGAKFRAAKQWLIGSEFGNLILGDDPDVFYKVKNVLIGTAEREVHDIGEFEVSFVCDGCQYIRTGQNEYTPDSVLINPYWTSKPIYKIIGEGECTIDVNGKTMSATVGQNLVIDTDLMLSYRTDGTTQNTNVTGNYEDLYLKNGKNTISISEGFDLKVIPNWRCL